MWKSKLEFLPVRKNFAPGAVKLVVTSGPLGGNGTHLAKFGVVIKKVFISPSLKKKKTPSLEGQRSSCLIQRTSELQLQLKSTFLLKN